MRHNDHEVGCEEQGSMKDLTKFYDRIST